MQVPLGWPRIFSTSSTCSQAITSYPAVRSEPQADPAQVTA